MEAAANRPLAPPIWRVLLAFSLASAAMAAALCVSAGRWNVFSFWIFLIATLPSLLAGFFFVRSRNPGVFVERFKPGPGERDSWTRKLAGPLVFVCLVVA